MKNILQVYLNIHIIAYLLFLSYIAYKMYFFIDTKFNYLNTEIEQNALITIQIKQLNEEI